jgi:hypothetical protein
MFNLSFQKISSPVQLLVSRQNDYFGKKRREKREKFVMGGGLRF